MLNTIRDLTRVEGLTNQEEVYQRLVEGFGIDELPDASQKRCTEDSTLHPNAVDALSIPLVILESELWLYQTPRSNH